MLSAIFEGTVYHKRFKPKTHQLKYKVFSFLFDLDELPVIDQKLKYFSHNRFNIFSFLDKDHGPGDGKPLRQHVENMLREGGIDLDGGSIRLLCYPRLFGYVFNPLSVYYCYDNNDQLNAIIYEVSNTFGQRHSYVIDARNQDKELIVQKCKKGFYVSPFMEMDAEYLFRMKPPSESISVSITQSDTEGKLLKASFNGSALALTDQHLVRMLLRYPLMTLKVILGIHWEALKLWRKGLKLVARPPAPSNPITLVFSNQSEPKS